MWEKGDNMKKHKKLVIIAVLMALLTGMPSLVQAANNEPEQTSFEYEDGYESGYHAGWKEGYKVGEDSAYEEGYGDGYEAGCQSGYEAGADSIIGWVSEVYGVEEETLRAKAYWEKYYDQTPQEDWEYSDYAEFYTDEITEYPVEYSESDEVELFEYEEIQ